MVTAFDNDKYITIQSEHIRERIAQFGNKLYLELGGKLFDEIAYVDPVARFVGDYYRHFCR